MAPDRSVPATLGRSRGSHHQEGRARPIEGSLVSSTHEPANGKGKKAPTTKITSWSIRADVVRRLDRAEPEPEAAPAENSAVAEPGDTPF